jgi:hypothetical protein
MSKRIAFLGDSGHVYEAIPYQGTYPGDAITINEDVAGQAEQLARFVKTDVADSFDERGLCEIYRDGSFVDYVIFDKGAFWQWNSQGGYNVFAWVKAQLTDTEDEQILTTGNLPIDIGSVASGQTAFPTFEAPVRVIVNGTPYQDRLVYLSTAASISSGDVTFGITLGAGQEGDVYADIIIIQMKP